MIRPGTRIEMVNVLTVKTIGKTVKSLAEKLSLSIARSYVTRARTTWYAAVTATPVPLRKRVSSAGPLYASHNGGNLRTGV